MIIKNIDIEEGQLVYSDICIIGGGPAAISLALELRDIKKNVIVLTGGKLRETAFNRELHRGIIEPDCLHVPLEEYRRRQFGGASSVWGGRCLPFEPIDFVNRDWVNDSGWPLDYKELLPYYKKAAKLTRIGNFKFNVDDMSEEIISGMDSEYLISTAIERWSPPVNFAREYIKDLKSSNNLKVYINAHALMICTDFEGDIVSHVEVYMNGKRFKIAASKFVLAAGGLENPRLLLTSSSLHHPHGMGNKYDNVGRYYMQHISGNYAVVYLKDINRIKYDYERDEQGVYCRRRWRLTDYAQRELKLLNTIFFLDHPYGKEEYLASIFSGIVVAKSLMAIASQKSVKKALHKARELSPSLKKHSINLILKGWNQVPNIVKIGLKRINRRRLPSVLPYKKSKYWGIFFQAEQSPFRESRVTLTNQEKDDLGMPRLKVDFRYNPADIESVIRAHNLFISHFQKSGAGSAIYSEEGFRNYLDKHVSGSHHIGTTRMASSELNGVVDLNSKVYGIKNLFIAGASVFPTGSHANPMLTIVAQSLRLANYIKENI